MNKVIRAEFGRTINAGLIIAIAGIIFSICFDSFNDLIAGLRNGQGYVGYFSPMLLLVECVPSICCRYLQHCHFL